MSYMFLEHTADVKFRAEGASVEEMFVASAEAMNETIRGEIKILEQEERSFEVESKAIDGHDAGEPDYVGLLYNFLEEFLFLLDAEDYLVSKIKEISIEDGKLKCVIVGDAAENYKFTNDVKAVTYSEMFVREENGKDGESGAKKFICEVVLDV